MAPASRTTFAAWFVLSLVGYGALLVLLGLWEGTVGEVWLPGPLTSAPTSATVPGDPDMPATLGLVEVRARTFGEVWGDWHANAVDGWFGPAEVAFLLVFVLGPSLLWLLAWINLPLVHGTGSAWHSYKRSFRAAAGIIAPAGLLTLGCGALFIVLKHAQIRGTLSVSFPFFVENVLLVSAAISATLLVVWLSRAARAVAVESDALALSPRCEGCGYDLTHQPAEARCPECGMALAASLDERISRPGCAWARRKTAASWLTTTLMVLFRPHAFYRTLKLRTSIGSDAGFAAWQYVAIACGAVIWTGVMVAVLSRMHGPPPPGFVPGILAYACGVVLWGTLGCWLGHRAIAALVATWWLLHGALPDGRWTAKVVAYEAAFLWVFCAFWGLLATSIVFLEAWISRLLGLGTWPGPGEFLAALVGTLALGVLWLWRHSVAYRAIRWSNF